MTERSLSREQVDRLLELIDKGEISLDEGPARPYPLRQVDLGPVRGAVERWLEETARAMENWLILNVSNKMTCTSGGFVPRAGPIKAPPAALALIGAGEQDALVSVWERDVVEALLGGMLGYKFTAALPKVNESRQLTEIDLRMLQRGAQGLAQGLTQAWPRGDQKFTVEGVSSDLGGLDQGSGAAPAMAANIIVRLGESILGRIEFSLPGWIGRDLRAVGEAATPLTGGSPEMRDVVSGLELDVEIRVPVGEFTLKQILALEKGDELVLPSPARALVQTEGVTCLEGVPGIVDGQWAIAVGPTEEGEDHGDERD
jgi:hypothetical protein